MSLIVAPDPAPAPAPAVVADPVAPAAVAPAAASTDPVDALFAEPGAVAPAVVSPSAVPPVRPDGVPDSLWDAATGVKTTEALARLAELETAETTRNADVPADASGYKLELAEPINDPSTGKPIAFDATDPLAKGAVAWAEKNKVSQGALSELLGVFATNHMADLATFNATVAAETAKLGPSSQARIDAVTASLTKHSDAAGAKAVMSSLGSAEAVIALEKVIKGLAGPSFVTPPPADPKAALSDLSGVDLLAASLK